jgi:hypothetical protein
MLAMSELVHITECGKRERIFLQSFRCASHYFQIFL